MAYRLTMRAAAKRRWHPKPEDQRPISTALPRRRRVAIIVDYDSGEPVMHVIEMLRTNRADSYRVEIDDCNWSPMICETCGYRPCDGSC